VGMHAHTKSGHELSRSTGDARRVERVVVVVGTGSIADDAFDTALVVAQVMRVEQTRGTAGEAVGGVWRGRQVGLGEVEPGGAPASHVFVKSSRTHERAGSGSTQRSHAKARASRCRKSWRISLHAKGVFGRHSLPLALVAGGRRRHGRVRRRSVHGRDGAKR